MALEGSYSGFGKYPEKGYAQGDLEVMNEIKEASKKGDIVATGNFNYPSHSLATHVFQS